uniref:Tyrosinase-related protein 1 n=1 Tax=Globodera pallida TaxID=36090 RepID=A0A183CR10_GLOPA
CYTCDYDNYNAVANQYGGADTPYYPASYSGGGYPYSNGRYGQLDFSVNSTSFAVFTRFHGRHFASGGFDRRRAQIEMRSKCR